MPGIKDTKTEMRNDGFISRLKIADVRISELEDISIESAKIEKQREKRLEGKQNRIFTNGVTTTKGLTHTQWKHKKERKERKEQNTENNMQDFPGGTVNKNPPANAGDMGSIPGLGRFHVPQSN